ncbi:hypothetical protein HZA86_04410 [Candidatus Uhrbacteria bacterium]|nr:hypothetical protein [Candidatus Uhrbacteria bacterium]
MVNVALERLRRLLDVLIAWTGASLWVWMVLESIKPGLVSYYWDLAAHSIMFAVLCVADALLWARVPALGEGRVGGQRLPSVLLIVAAVVGIVIVVGSDEPLLMAAIVLLLVGVGLGLWGSRDPEL